MKAPPSVSNMPGPIIHLEALEAEKLSLEIAAKKRPFFRKVNFWIGVVLPMVAGQGWTITGCLSGDWDQQLQALRAEKRDLERQKEELRGDVAVMGAAITVLEAQNTALTSDKEATELENRKLEEQGRGLRLENENLAAQIESHGKMISHLERQAEEFQSSAEAAMRGLNTLSKDTKALFEGKMTIFRIVQASDVPQGEKGPILDKLHGLLDVIRETDTHVSRVRAILKKMTVGE